MQDLGMLLSDLKDKSILITGGSGFFGKNLCESLVAMNLAHHLNMKIYALARTPVTMAGVHFVAHDVSTPFTFQEPIDYIIHAATPVTGGDEAFDKIMNVIINGTEQVLNFAEKMNCKKFILISSGAVYGEQPQDLEKIPEDYFARELFYDAKSAYSTGKRVSELLALDWAKKTGQHLTIARCFAFSGKHLPLDQHLAIGNFVRDAITTGVIQVKGDGSGIRSYMDAEDLVKWIMTILLRGESGDIFNVGSDQSLTMKELAHKIADKVPGARVEIQNLNSSTSTKRNRYVPSIEKAFLKLKLKVSVSLDESIQRMIEFNKGLI